MVAAEDAFSGGRVTFTDGSTLNLASNVVIYKYDKSDDKTTVGSYSDRLDLVSDDVQHVAFYKTATKTDDDNYGLVDYIVIYQK